MWVFTARVTMPPVGEKGGRNLFLAPASLYAVFPPFGAGRISQGQDSVTFMEETQDNDAPQAADAPQTPDAEQPSPPAAKPKESPRRSDDPTPGEAQAAVEAVLFASDHPLNASRVAHAERRTCSSPGPLELRYMSA